MRRHFLIPIDGAPVTRKAARVGNALAFRLDTRTRIDAIDRRSEEVGVPFIRVVAN